MSDLFRDKAGIDTEATSEYTQLFDTHLATERGQFTDQIISVLSEDKNQAPYKVLSYVKEQGFLICLAEDSALPDNIRVDFINNTNAPEGNILLAKVENSEDIARHFKIEEKTYSTLQNFKVDLAIAKANVSTKLSHAI